VGCKVQHDPAEDIDAGPPNAAERAKLVAEALPQAKPFQDRKELVLDDPKITEPCLDKALKFVTNGNMPPPSQRGSVLFFTAACISGEGQVDGGLTVLEKKIEDHYEHPTITKEGSKVTIDVGIVSGNLQRAAKRGLIVGETPRLVDHQLTKSEVVRFLKMGIAKYPDASVYRLDAEIPSFMSGSSWHYVYDRHVVRVWDPTARYGVSAVAEVSGGNLDAITTLETSKLKSDSNSPPLP